MSLGLVEQYATIPLGVGDFYLAHPKTSPVRISVRSQHKRQVPKRRLDPWSSQTQQHAAKRVCLSKLSGLQRTIVEPILHQAVNVFLSDTVVSCGDVPTSKGHFATLLPLIQSSSSLDALPRALEAVALASFANRACHAAIQHEAARRYSQSVHRLRQTFLDPKTNVRSTIACIVLLSLYEVSAIGAVDAVGADVQVDHQGGHEQQAQLLTTFPWHGRRDERFNRSWSNTSIEHSLARAWFRALSQVVQVLIFKDMDRLC